MTLDVSVSQAFDFRINLHDNRIVQDDNPSQNYALAQEIIANLCAGLLPILVWSSDVNLTGDSFSSYTSILVKDK